MLPRINPRRKDDSIQLSAYKYSWIRLLKQFFLINCLLVTTYSINIVITLFIFFVLFGFLVYESRVITQLFQSSYADKVGWTW